MVSEDSKNQADFVKNFLILTVDFYNGKKSLYILQYLNFIALIPYIIFSTKALASSELIPVLLSFLISSPILTGILLLINFKKIPFLFVTGYNFGCLGTHLLTGICIVYYIFQAEASTKTTIGVSVLFSLGSLISLIAGIIFGILFLLSKRIVGGNQEP